MSELTPDEYIRALERGRSANEAQFRPCSIAYDPETHAIELKFEKGTLAIPISFIPELDCVPSSEFAKLALWPDGSCLELDHLDIHISVDGLIRRIFL